MKKIIDKLINHSIKGVDVYRYKGATWLIFSDEKRWVVELTDNGTLWYNYNFFNDIFKYVSLECGEFNDYIIGWANDYFFKDINKAGMGVPGERAANIVINEGVMEVKERGKNHGNEFEWHTRAVMNHGVKEVRDSLSYRVQNRAENLMGRIVKDAKPNSVVVPVQGMDRFYYDPGCSANTTDIWMVVEEGVKEIMPSTFISKRGTPVDDVMCSGNTTDINVIVKNGIKNIYPDQNSGDYDWSDEFDANKVIDGGVKV